MTSTTTLVPWIAFADADFHRRAHDRTDELAVPLRACLVLVGSGFRSPYNVGLPLFRRRLSVPRLGFLSSLPMRILDDTLLALSSLSVPVPDAALLMSPMIPIMASLLRQRVVPNTGR